MKILVKNNGPLHGEIEAGGSKNSALPIMAATMLCTGECNLYNIPNLTDTKNMKQIMENLGCEIDGTRYNSRNLSSYFAPYEGVKKLRGSFLLAAPLLTRFQKASIPFPGGCPIGTRPIDLHLKGFRKMGAEIDFSHGTVELNCKRLHGERIYLDFPSVGATENLIMAASLAHGETVIENAAQEPEIIDLCDFLSSCGAKIYGDGSGVIAIEGVDELKPANHRIISDRIEAGTYLVAYAITHGRGRIKNVRSEHQKPLIAKLVEMGVRLYEDGDDILIDAECDIDATSIKTMPYPGFPTDMQAQFTALLSVTNGTGVVVETVFENRFLHIGELLRMGANIRTDGRTSVIEGVKRLTGAKVEAHDLRGGAALVLAGLTAEGETEISGAELISRGYENFANKINSVGGNVSIIEK